MLMGKMAISLLAIPKEETPVLGNGDPSTLVLVCLIFSGWWGKKHSQPPDFLRVINAVQNSSFNTRKCFLLLFRVTPDADVLSYTAQVTELE